MAVRRSEEFAYLVPVDIVGVLEGKAEPAAVTMVRRPGEPSVLPERVEFEWVGS